MLLPIGDDNSQRVSFPLITLSLIAINCYVFWLELQGGDAFVLRYSAVPSALLSGEQSPIVILTSMFIHGGWMHLLGNMLYLYVFGDNVEDDLGKIKYLIFYLLCGVAAMVAQVLVNPSSDIPSLGASGAIAGVLAAYIILFPRNKIRVLIFFPFTWRMSAWFVLGLWIITQLSAGYTDIFSHQGNQTGGVAYMAHIGGFFTGVILTFVFRSRRAASGVAQRLGSR